jgi:hypothetical protein
MRQAFVQSPDIFRKAAESVRTPAKLLQIIQSPSGCQAKIAPTTVRFPESYCGGDSSSPVFRMKNGPRRINDLEMLELPAGFRFDNEPGQIRMTVGRVLICFGAKKRIDRRKSTPRSRRKRRLRAQGVRRKRIPGKIIKIMFSILLFPYALRHTPYATYLRVDSGDVFGDAGRFVLPLHLEG